MPRKPRQTVAGGIYHVFSRGNRRQPTFTSDESRRRHLWGFGDCAKRFGWRFLAWCQMTNHDHFVVETPEDTLSRGMQRLNGQYAQWFNDTHGLDGHLFQGRFGSVLILTDEYLLHVCRYVLLNPVTAGLCSAPEDWRWSSYAPTIGLAPSPDFLDYRRLLAYFGDDVESARGAFARFVRHGTGESLLDMVA